MLINLIVGSALVLTGLYCWFWLRSPALRARIEHPKYVFLEQARQQDGLAPLAGSVEHQPVQASHTPAPHAPPGRSPQ